jgi:benzodiazapine receptor
MTRTSSLLIALAICTITAALEGLCAGKNVKAYFAKLKFPAYSPPLWVWYFIGFAYYAIFFFVIYRTLRHQGDAVLKNSTLTLVLFMMGANALWNYVFFRAQNLFVSYVGSSLAPVFDIALLVCLIRLDHVAAWALVPYLVYRLYAVWWGYGLWKENRPSLDRSNK